MDALAPGPSPARHGIALRHFAGHASYVGQLEPIRVVHLTDMHVGRVTPLAVQKAAVELAKAENPDVVVITGDFVCHSQAYLEDLAEVMRGFTVPVFGVLGNHDHWCGADAVRRTLKKAGVELLDNAWTALHVKGQTLQIVGVDDAYTSHHDLSRATSGLHPHVPTLGLSHIAEEADAFWERGIPMVLSGHTHAGQITLARLHELALGKLAGHRYVHGMYGSRRTDPREQGAVYVGAGIGAAVMPLRLGERGKRELTVFDLGMAPGTRDEHHDDQPAMPGRAPSEKTRHKRAQAVLKKATRRERRMKPR